MSLLVNKWTPNKFNPMIYNKLEIAVNKTPFKSSWKDTSQTAFVVGKILSPVASQLGKVETIEKPKTKLIINDPPNNTASKTPMVAPVDWKNIAIKTANEI